MVLHIPSLSYIYALTRDIPYFNCFQNAQMASRLCDLNDPNVTMIYVTPFPVERAVVQYYMKILAASGIRGAEDRVTFLSPENIMRLPKNISLTKAVLWSTKVMKDMRRLTEGKVQHVMD